MATIQIRKQPINSNTMTEEHKQQIDEAADKYGFVVPFNGTNNFYNDDKVLGFLSGAEFGYQLAESHYQQLLEVEREKVRRLRGMLYSMILPQHFIVNFPDKESQSRYNESLRSAEQLLTDIPE